MALANGASVYFSTYPGYHGNKPGSLLYAGVFTRNYHPIDLRNNLQITLWFNQY